MSSARFGLTIASALLAASPAQTTVPRGCELIAAFAQPDVAALRGIRTDVGKDGLIDLSYRGRETAIRNASACELSRGDDDLYFTRVVGKFEIDCTWSNGIDLDGANEIHARLKTELGRCLPGGWLKRDDYAREEEYKVFQQIEGKIEGGDNRKDVSIELSIGLHTGDGQYLHQVYLSISR